MDPLGVDVIDRVVGENIGGGVCCPVFASSIITSNRAFNTVENTP